MMLTACNGVLANGLGNLAQRSLSLVFKNCDKHIPAAPSPDALTDEDNALLKAASELPSKVDEVLDANQQLHNYCRTVHFFIKSANVYIDQQEPWALKKTDPERMKTVLWVVLEVVRQASILLQPVMPNAMEKMLDQLGVPADQRMFADILGSPLEANAISKPVAVFPRVEAPAEAAQ
uniref:Methionyl-tRNA synthetase anticodon-binding domain-containing protein n=1 Tax=Lotharella oceanica TaxID=641309 RepID=A0A7S2TWL1_9EUKA|mmetsp:Transcript_31378/g.58513  ORF Transcript_31378/g.58513 Transcript_31378/m.58513 type:complete len:178 (+) Transcript_31378:127-660(+)